jgi:hypothetical protein
VGIEGCGQLCRRPVKRRSGAGGARCWVAMAKTRSCSSHVRRMRRRDCPFNGLKSHDILKPDILFGTGKSSLKACYVLDGR